jgi:nitroreductase
MSSILEFLNSHGSVRKFTGQEISEEDEMTIVTTAERSPTSSNLHAYSIIGTREADTKLRLAELCGNQKHVAQASLFLVFCADLHRLSRIAEVRGYEFSGDHTEMFIVATVDASLAACRALMAAQALGLGGVMVGGIRNNPEDVAGLLNLPDLVYPVMGMSLGYPESEATVKPRMPIEGIYLRERYSDVTFEDAIRDFDATIDDAGYLKGREVESDQYPDFSGAYSWSEHAARRMASQRPDVRRGHMLTFLQDRGFLKK